MRFLAALVPLAVGTAVGAISGLAVARGYKVRPRRAAMIGAVAGGVAATVAGASTTLATKDRT